MADGFFLKGKGNLLKGNIDLLTDTIKVVFVDHADDIPNLDTDEFLSDILADARVDISPALAGKDVTLNVFNASPVTAPTVVGDTFESIVLFKDTGNPATSPLLYYSDEAVGLPCTPDGSDILITWDVGPKKIFKL